MFSKRTQVLVLLIGMFVLGFCLVRFTGLGLAISQKVEQGSASALSTTTVKDMVDSEAPTPIASSTDDVTTPIVTEVPITPPVIKEEPAKQSGKCFVGGCSGQLCSDSPDMVSTCEWRESYACYKEATCERQPAGNCGWTETPELKSCLINADTGIDFEAENQVQ